MTPAYSALDPQADRPAVVIHAFREWRDPQPALEILDRVIAVVCQTWAVSREELLSRAKPLRLADPRIAMYALARKATRLSSIEIGRAFGREHGSILYGVKAAAARVETDPHFATAFGVAASRLGITP